MGGWNWVDENSWMKKNVGWNGLDEMSWIKLVGWNVLDEINGKELELDEMNEKEQGCTMMWVVFVFVCVCKTMLAGEPTLLKHGVE